MRLAPSLVKHLADAVLREFATTEIGHCLRVDYLRADDAQDACRLLRELAGQAEIRAHVLEAPGVDPELAISTEEAVELRNRKTCRLALFVPAGLVDTTASSLTNSFASFDLDRCFKLCSASLLDRLPDEISGLVRQCLGALRGTARPTAEARADYLAAVSEQPALETVGRELWRVGLIPDAGSDGLTDRLENNLRCVRHLVRPVRAHTSAAERLAGLGLRPGAVYDELLEFLSSQRLRDARTWLALLAAPERFGRLSFDRWVFEALGASDLERIEVAPLQDANGCVEGYTKLLQPRGPGTALVAKVGSKVTVRWKAFPATPGNIARWRVEVVPEAVQYTPEEAASFEPPTAATSAKQRRATVKLDVDLSVTEVRAVQFRVVAVDTHGAPIALPDGQVIEGRSEEFWLSDEELEVPEPKQKRETVPTLPYGRLKVAVDKPCGTLNESPGQWTEGDLHYFSVTVNGRTAIRVGLSPVLRRIETRCIENPDELGAYDVVTDTQRPLELAAFRVRALDLGDRDAARSFVVKRREVFKLIAAQKFRGLVETAQWNPDLARAVRSYARAYRELLEASGPEGVATVLSVDTIHFEVNNPNRQDRAALLFPTHPLRLLWYSAYADLLEEWTKSLCAAGDRERPAIDLELLRQVTPLNFPAFTVDQSHEPLLCSQNLRFFWGVALPLCTPDPARLFADIARAVGLSDEDATLADFFPGRLAEEFNAYRRSHPYAAALRVSVVNPGSGSFVAGALREFLRETLEPDDENDGSTVLPRVELLAEALESSHSSFSAFTDLQRDLYDAQPPGRRSHLNPLFSVAIRPLRSDDQSPARDTNVTLLIDQLRPRVLTALPDSDEDSVSFYGLITRMIPRFISSDALTEWSYRIGLPAEASRERHPTSSAYTSDLVDTHREILRAVAEVVGGANTQGLPEIHASLDHDQRARIDRLHGRSDWVVTLDRFFGVEYFDEPLNPDLARVARKYLLDYAPDFLDGVGHRMVVTTTHRGEVEELLARAMRDLGFDGPPEAVNDILENLKAVSGRLALEVLAEEPRVREAACLGAAVTYLRSLGDLNDCLLVPVAAHPQLLAAGRRRRRSRDEVQRCDLLRVQFSRARVVATFIEVKPAIATANQEEVLHRIADQILGTEGVFRSLYFSDTPRRLDHLLQRSRLVTLFRFYLRRAARYGRLTSPDQVERIQESLAKLESGLGELKVNRQGIIVDPRSGPQEPLRFREVDIRFLTRRELASVGLVSAPAPPQPAQGVPSRVSREPESPKALGHKAGPADERPADDFVVSVELGTMIGSGEAAVWRAGVKGSPHLFILGIPGQGKSWTLTRILCELGQQGLPALVLDFHGQFAAAGGYYAHHVQPMVLNAAEGLPFSPFEADVDERSGASYWKANAFAVAEIMQYVTGLGDIQRDVVYEALRDCYEQQGFAERKPRRLPTINEFALRLEEREQRRGIKNVVPRCRPLLEFGLFREVSGGVPFEELLRRGVVIDVHSLGLETLQLAAGAFVLRKVYKDMFRWGEAERLRLAIVLDEAHRLARDITLPKIMKEGRKFGIVVVVASQGLADYHPDVVGNAGTKVVFRTNFPMSKKVAGFLRTAKNVDLAASIEQLSVGEALVQTPVMSTSCRVRMHPLDLIRLRQGI